MKNIKLGDIIVIAVILLASAGIAVFRFAGAEGGNSVVITVDGKESVYSLREDRSVDIDSNGIRLCVKIEGGCVFVEKSACPNQSCVNMGEISRKGEAIACVPARVYVKITGEGDGGYDYVIG